MESGEWLFSKDEPKVCHRRYASEFSAALQWLKVLDSKPLNEALKARRPSSNTAIPNAYREAKRAIAAGEAPPSKRPEHTSHGDGGSYGWDNGKKGKAGSVKDNGKKGKAAPAAERDVQTPKLKQVVSKKSKKERTSEIDDYTSQQSAHKPKKLAKKERPSDFDVHAAEQSAKALKKESAKALKKEQRGSAGGEGAVKKRKAAAGATEPMKRKKKAEKEEEVLEVSALLQQNEGDSKSSKSTKALKSGVIKLTHNQQPKVQTQAVVLPWQDTNAIGTGGVSAW